LKRAMRDPMEGEPKKKEKKEPLDVPINIHASDIEYAVYMTLQSKVVTS